MVPLRHRGLSDVTSAAVDLADLNSPHTLAALSVPPGAVVLDVGCGPGIVSRALAERGCRVYGIEIDSRKAAVARASCVEVAEADLETVSLPALFAGQRFDAILCLDVLEHLKNPVAVLSELRAMLAPGGAVLISVPNVTHGALRLELLQGRFGYRNSGLLDRGHLRFFDGRALADLVRGAGFFAETTLRVIRRLDQTEFEIDLDAVPESVLQSLERDPDALTYQFFVVARPLRDGQSINEGSSLPERLRARLDLVTAELEKAGTYARSLEAELKNRDIHLQSTADQASRIAELSAELDKSGGYARSLEAELRQRNAHLQNLTAQETRIGQLSAELAKASDYARHLEAEIAKRDERMRELEALGLERRTRADTLEAELGQAGTYARGLEERLSASESRAEALASALQSRQEQADGLAAAAVTREGIVEDLQRLLDDQSSYARYLEAELRKRAGELAVYDDELHVLRAHVQKTEAAIAALQGRIEVSDRDLRYREDQLRVMRLELTVAEDALGERDGELARAARESADLTAAVAEDRQRLAEATRLLDRYRVRLATRGADAFVQKTPGLYRVLRGVLATVLERWRPTEFQR
ncbi:MAG TPA: methyltransferase domain-containing protein [Vicinamibacterales bacterium]|nr:methyltransferase domain-containing protein [Vicinamibacterales bacterium]